MKKIFGMLSLIAILTVAFSTNASALDYKNVNDVGYVIGSDNVTVDVIAVANVEVINVVTFEVFDVTKYSEGNLVSAVNKGSLTYINTLNSFDSFVAVPIDYGLLDKTNTILFLNSNTETFVDLPIDYGICFANKTNDNVNSVSVINLKQLSILEGYNVPIDLSVFG